VFPLLVVSWTATAIFVVVADGPLVNHGAATSHVIHESRVPRLIGTQPIGFGRIRQPIGEKVTGSGLDVTVTLQGSERSSVALGQRLVVLGPYPLAPGHQHISVVVDDGRGTLTGWRIAGMVSGGHDGVSWQPSVALTHQGGSAPAADHGPSGVLSEVKNGPAGVLVPNQEEPLCSAPQGGGGGEFSCTATLRVPKPGATLSLYAEP
jgi:hypothetical protein